MYIVCYYSVIFGSFILFSDQVSVSWLVNKIKIMRRYVCALTCPIECTCRHEYWNFYFDLERETLGKNNGYCYYVSLWPISKKAMIGKQLCEIGIMLFTMTDNVSNMPWSYWLSSDLEQHLLWYSDPYRFLSTSSFFCYRLPSSLQMHRHLSRRVQREKELLHLLQSPRYPLQSSKSLYSWHGIFKLIPELMNIPCYCDDLTL